MPSILSVLHRTIDACEVQKEIPVTKFENATGMMLAIAAQALAVGLILAL
jgi:hypothetical protein